MPGSVEGQSGRVQTGAAHGRLGEQGIADDRMSDPGEMDPDLVATSRNGLDDEQCMFAVVVEAGEARLRWVAAPFAHIGGSNRPAGSVLVVDDRVPTGRDADPTLASDPQGEVDGSLLGHAARSGDRDVVLGDGTPVELAGQRAVRLEGLGEHDQPGGDLVDPVRGHQSFPGVGGEAYEVGAVAFTGHRDARRFVEHHDPGVLVHHGARSQLLPGLRIHALPLWPRHARSGSDVQPRGRPGNMRTMAGYTIRKIGDPVLTRRTEEVTDIDGRIAKLADDMLQTMYDEPGVGLAANQVGISKRLFVYDIGHGPVTVINPRIVETDGEFVYDEGCLSIPGLSFELARPDAVHLVGLDLEGNEISIEADELEGRALQHEMDHLDGILYLERLDDDQRKAAKKALREMNLAATKEPAAHGGLRLP